MSEHRAEQPEPTVSSSEASAALLTKQEQNESLESALKTHAMNMERKHAAPDPTGCCELCESMPAKWDMELRWSADYNTREDVVRSAVGLVALLAVGHGQTFSHKARFTTHHGCCSTCYCGLVTKRLIAGAAEMASFGLLIMGMLGTATALMFGTILRANPSTEDRSVFMWAVGISIIGLGLGFLLPRSLRGWKTPRTLRSVGVSPFVLEGSQRSRRPAGHAR